MLRPKSPPCNCLFSRKITRRSDKLQNLGTSSHSRAKKENFYQEFDKVWVHGILHLVGYDHKKNIDYLKMARTERKILDLIN